MSRRVPSTFRFPMRRGSAPSSPRRGAGTAAAALVIAATALAACGATGHRTARGFGATTTPLAGGPRVFAAACSSCHTLTGRSGRVTQGGDLAGFRLSERVMTSFTRIMPVSPPLSRAQIRAVSAYVVAVENRYAQRHR